MGLGHIFFNHKLCNTTIIPFQLLLLIHNISLVTYTVLHASCWFLLYIYFETSHTFFMLTSIMYLLPNPPYIPRLHDISIMYSLSNPPYIPRHFYRSKSNKQKNSDWIQSRCKGFIRCSKSTAIRHATVRETGASQHHGSTIKDPLKPLKHHGNMVTRGLRLVLN